MTPTPLQSPHISTPSPSVDPTKLSDRDRQKLREQERRRREAVSILFLIYSIRDTTALHHILCCYFQLLLANLFTVRCTLYSGHLSFKAYFP